MTVDPYKIIEKYYTPGSLAYTILVAHSTMVCSKATTIATRRNKLHKENQVNIQLVQEWALLHDIWICTTKTPDIGNTWNKPYLHHIVAWYEILLKEELPKHARIALTHTWCWIHHSQIKERKLPLSLELNYLPQSLEEKIVSYADLFYTKHLENLYVEKTPKKIKKEQQVFWLSQVDTFNKWHSLFDL